MSSRHEVRQKPSSYDRLRWRRIHPNRTPLRIDLLLTEVETDKKSHQKKPPFEMKRGGPDITPLTPSTGWSPTLT
jgi:hypothetical protein